MCKHTGVNIKTSNFDIQVGTVQKSSYISPTSEIYVEKKTGIVHFYTKWFSNFVSVPAAGTAIMTLPAAFCPSRYYRAIAIVNQNGVFAIKELEINKNGVCALQGGTSGITAIMFDTSFLAE